MNAWETTTEDIEHVLDAHNLNIDAEEIFDKLDHYDIEDSALWGDEMDEQSVYALQEIEHQLIQLGYLPEGTETKFNL